MACISRVISAQKANTANSLSLNGLALSTANLYSAVQPGGSLFGLQESNPVNIDAAYGGNADEYGTTSDFMIGKRIGGVNVFGGGVALYDASGAVIGAVGVSGDTSCADHSIAWKVRDYLLVGPNSDAASWTMCRAASIRERPRQHRLRHRRERRQPQRLGPPDVPPRSGRGNRRGPSAPDD